jgi:hypothetical protein
MKRAESAVEVGGEADVEEAVLLTLQDVDAEGQFLHSQRHAAPVK